MRKERKKCSFWANDHQKLLKWEVKPSIIFGHSKYWWVSSGRISRIFFGFQKERKFRKQRNIRLCLLVKVNKKSRIYKHLSWIGENGILLPKLFRHSSLIEKTFWNSRLKAKNLQKIWDHKNNFFEQWKVRTIFGNRMLF